MGEIITVLISYVQQWVCHNINRVDISTNLMKLKTSF